MYPSSFEYARPSTLDEAIQLLQGSGGDAKLLAGGHSLLPLMKLRLAEPSKLIDLGRLKDSLAYIRRENGHVSIGALTTHHALEMSDDLRQAVPALVDAAAQIGDAQVRNRGTIGGSLAHADPTADLPAVMLALGAQMVAQGPGGRRTLAADDFFVDLLTTALRPDEVLVEVRLPAASPGSGAAYRKFEQPASGYALVGVAAFVRVDGESIAEARVGVTGAGPRAYRASGVESGLVGKAPSRETIAAAAQHATDGIDVSGDIFAAPDYRAHLATVMAQRAIEGALERARG
jgi:aerobic carbon-monoxide dehydrogenase medium subunit